MMSLAVVASNAKYTIDGTELVIFNLLPQIDVERTIILS